MPTFKRISAVILLVISMLLICNSSGLWNPGDDNDAVQQNDGCDQCAAFVFESSFVLDIPESPEVMSATQPSSDNPFAPSIALLRDRAPRFSCHSLLFISTAGLMPRAPELA
jgi:hypothetical protein